MHLKFLTQRKLRVGVNSLPLLCSTFGVTKKKPKIPIRKPFAHISWRETIPPRADARPSLVARTGVSSRSKSLFPQQGPRLAFLGVLRRALTRLQHAASVCETEGRVLSPPSAPLPARPTAALGRSPPQLEEVICARRPAQFTCTAGAVARTRKPKLQTG